MGKQGPVAGRVASQIPRRLSYPLCCGRELAWNRSRAKLAPAEGKIHAHKKPATEYLRRAFSYGLDSAVSSNSSSTSFTLSSSDSDCVLTTRSAFNGTSYGKDSSRDVIATGWHTPLRVTLGTYGRRCLHIDGQQATPISAGPSRPRASGATNAARSTNRLAEPTRHGQHDASSSVRPARSRGKPHVQAVAQVRHQYEHRTPHIVWVQSAQVQRFAFAWRPLSGGRKRKARVQTLGLLSVVTWASSP